MKFPVRDTFSINQTCSQKAIWWDGVDIKHYLLQKDEELEVNREWKEGLPATTFTTKINITTTTTSINLPQGEEAKQEEAHPMHMKSTRILQQDQRPTPSRSKWNSHLKEFKKALMNSIREPIHLWGQMQLKKIKF